MCGSNKNKVHVAKSLSFLRAAPLSSVSAPCPNGATPTPQPWGAYISPPPQNHLALRSWLPRAIFSSPYQVFLCLAVLPTRPRSWTFHHTPCPARPSMEVPTWGAWHRIGLWTDWLVRHPWGLRSILSWCSGHLHLAKMLRKWGWQEDGSGPLSGVGSDSESLAQNDKRGSALGEPSGFAVLWLYDLSKQTTTDTAAYVGKVTYLILLLFSELCLPQSLEVTLKWHICWGACVKLKCNSVHLRTWLTHLDQSLCACTYTHVRVQTCWMLTAVLMFFLISLEREPFQQSNGG